jgi:hypothetical protein
MKPNKEAHLALRRAFTEGMAASRTANAAARKHILLGRKCREEARASTDPTLMLNRGLTMATEGVKMRLHGSRELCLALAFCNNTQYAEAEPQPTTKPNLYYLRLYLTDPKAICFDLPLNRLFLALSTWATSDQTPREILIAAFPDEAVVSEEPAQASA